MALVIPVYGTLLTMLRCPVACPAPEFIGGEYVSLATQACPQTSISPAEFKLQPCGVELMCSAVCFPPTCGPGVIGLWPTHSTPLKIT